MSMKNICFIINGGAKVHSGLGRFKIPKLLGLIALLMMLHTSLAFAQGSIFGAVHNANASVPANGEIGFYGFIDNTDEEIRIESSVGAGYDAGNWFDDFQNYLTKAPGLPYRYNFYNTTNFQGVVLSKTVPNNSFQQEDVTLAPVAWPVAPTGFSSRVVSGTSVVISWTRTAGLTYHIYRRPATSDGSFFRIDSPAGSLANPGVADSFYVDNTVDGVSSYHFLLIAQDGSGNLGPHSAIFTVNSASLAPPIVNSITPNIGTYLGGTPVIVRGTGFDMAGATVNIGPGVLISVTVVSPYQINGVTPVGAVGAVNISVRNNAAALTSAPLTGGFTYEGNQPPVLAAIGPRSTTENVILTFGVSAADPDGTTPVLSTSALPGTATFVNNLNGTGTFNWTPSFTSAGAYPVTFYANDGIAIDSEIVTITVIDAGNQPPVLDPIGPRSVAEGGNLNFNITSSDIDATIPSLSATNIPTNATFLDNGNGTGTFNFNPDLSQAGSYSVTFKAFDGALVDSEVVVITVTNSNQAPVLAAIGPQTTTENVNLNFNVTATDADLQTLTLTTSTLPNGASFTDLGNGTATFDWTPTFTQSGVYAVTFRVSDGLLLDSEIVSITVTEAGNQPPVLDSIRAQTVAEGQVLARTITATDPDGSTPILSTGPLPANATFVDNSNGTGSFTFSPSFAQAGSYDVLFIASDGALADSELVRIVVTDLGNQPPVLSHTNDTTINEGDSLVVRVTATDPEGGGVRLSISTSLVGYNYVDSGNGVGLFRFRASYLDAGIDTIRFFATDMATLPLSSSDTMTVTILDVNRPPIIDSIGPFAVSVGRTLSFAVTATDSTDSNPAHRLYLSVFNLPLNATFVDSGQGIGHFTFTPASGQAGVDTVQFMAIDEGTPRLTDIQDVIITVVASNNPPVFTALPPYGITTEGDTLTLLVRATDADGQAITLSAVKFPLHSTFVDSGNGSGVFVFMPSYVQSGLHQVVFTASDGIDVNRGKATLIQVLEAGNQKPRPMPLSRTTVMEAGLSNSIPAMSRMAFIISISSLMTGSWSTRQWSSLRSMRPEIRRLFSRLHSMILRLQKCAG
ncbi:MAG: Ig-like domain-containing protein [candidate division Zixibacteria bacterium]|nr:Ig-like domain-containing protein [candidate division Zixibacteria bacterium]